MRAFRMVLVIAALAGGMSIEASAGSIEAAEAAELLTGRTWSGENPDGSRFVFYHELDGSFSARITSASAGTKVYGGRWQPRGSEICWAWDGWKTFCYHRFEREESELAMTRSDQVVHAGKLVDGNPEGL